jgi:hypothetical protein
MIKRRFPNSWTIASGTVAALSGWDTSLLAVAVGFTPGP